MKILLFIIICIIVSNSQAQMYAKVTTGSNGIGNSTGCFGIGYRLGRTSPNIRIMFETYLNREMVSGGSNKNLRYNISPIMGFDISLINKAVEVYVPMNFGAQFRSGPTNINYSLFSELGIGLQRAIDKFEFGGDVGFHYLVINYDHDFKHPFIHHTLSQYISIHLKFYL